MLSERDALLAAIGQPREQIELSNGTGVLETFTFMEEESNVARDVARRTVVSSVMMM